MKKVVAIDRAFPSYNALTAALAPLDAQLVFAEEKSDAALASLCKDADAVMVTYTKVGADLINAMDHCSMIIRTGIGVDNIDLEAAKAKGIQVSFVPDYCREEVADHTVGLVLDIVRKISLCNKCAKETWDMKKRMGYVPRLSNCTVGILSFGAIGHMIASRMQSFQTQVWAYDPFLSEDVFAKAGVKQCKTQEELFRGADIIILTGPLTPDRFHIINDETIAMMKETAFVINTGRGPLVDEAALIRALKAGRLAGAGLDVFEKEPIEDLSIYDLDNLVITPHVAFVSCEAFPDLERKVYDEVIRAIKGEPLRVHI